MPPKTRARPLTGGSKFMELMKKARKAGVVSKGLRAVAPHTKRSALLEKIAGVAESEGYGRRRRIAGRGPGMDKFKAKAKQAWQFVKDKKLISKGLATAAPWLGQFAPIATAAAGVANSLGAGITLPQGGGGHPYRRIHGSGLGGRGLLLAGERRARPRVIPADAHEEIRGRGRIIGNRLY